MHPNSENIKVLLIMFEGYMHCISMFETSFMGTERVSSRVNNQAGIKFEDV